MVVETTACVACSLPMAGSPGCAHMFLLFEVDGHEVERERVRFDHEGRVCHDCGAYHGHYHHAECDAEQCPQCDGQLIACECALLGSRAPEIVPSGEER